MASDKAHGIHDLVVHDYGPGKRFVSLHMEVDGKDDIYLLHDEVDRVERNIFETLGCETVIHMDPIDIGNPILKNLSELLLNKAKDKPTKPKTPPAIKSEGLIFSFLFSLYFVNIKISL